MNTLDENIFTDCICPYLTGKIIDDILLVNKHCNKVVKADMKYLYNLFWKVEYLEMLGHKSKSLLKDGKNEGEKLYWDTVGKLCCKEFYKEGKQEGPPGTNGVAESKASKVQEQLYWYKDGQLYSTEFY